MMINQFSDWCCNFYKIEEACLNSVIQMQTKIQRSRVEDLEFVTGLCESLHRNNQNEEIDSS